MEFFKERGYKYSIILLFVFAIIARLWFYLPNQSLWFDEAGLAINFITKTYKGLLGGLDYLQAAPAGFCILEKLMLDIVRPQNDSIRDYILRLIPLLSGILSLPAFYCLAKLVFNDKVKRLAAFAIFSLNTHAILYCSQCKQYTLELLLSVILITLFYKMLKDEYKWFYSFIIAISPWFSYSSFFIIAAGFLALLIKNRKQFVINVIPFILSAAIYYFVSLKSVFLVNYAGMDEVWITFKAFMDIHHPMRLFIRFGELFMLTKICAVLAGGIGFYSLVCFLFSKRESGCKILFTIPVILVIFASLMHKYPVYSRLVLFLLPVFAIAVTDIAGKFNNILKSVFIFIVIFSLLNNSIYAKEMAYSYARDVVDYLRTEIKPEDKIIMDNDATEYYFYLEGKGINNKIYKMPVTCIECNIGLCRDFVKTLPTGNYYLFSSHDNVEEVAKGYKLYELPFKPKYVKAVYFEKMRNK